MAEIRPDIPTEAQPEAQPASAESSAFPSSSLFFEMALCRAVFLIGHGKSVSDYDAVASDVCLSGGGVVLSDAHIGGIAKALASGARQVSGWRADSVRRMMSVGLIPRLKIEAERNKAARMNREAA
ncbi:hypothetical protein [Ferrovum sp.]|uniref:hypothetical protein n=1 Tax=Ferrovum sp. TaxID=2609467 RepID=UPI00261BD361|nr:hypothetical protein [Ferrovum sp.]